MLLTHHDLIRAVFPVDVDYNHRFLSRRRFHDQGNGTQSHPAIIDPDSDDDLELVPNDHRFELHDVVAVVPSSGDDLNTAVLEVLLHTVCENFCLHPSIDGSTTSRGFPQGLSNDDLSELIQLLNLLKAVEQRQHRIISSDAAADSVPPPYMQH
jgi:hypothetical protein